jgi:uncharacterized protein YodC (DUF2158 family)
MIVPGSVVQLKSGGPKMTVEKIAGSTCECVWYHYESRFIGGPPPTLQRANFLTYTLKTVEDKP